MDVFGPVNNDAGAEIAVGATAVSVFHDPVTNNGTIFVQPGGKVLMLENLAFSPTAALALPLAGWGDVGGVNVAGAATLDGNLDVSLSGGFVPAAGDRFTVLTSAGLSGTFDQPTIPGPAGSGVQFHPLYSATDVSVLVARTGDKTWGVDADGNSSLASNWLGGVAPGGVDDKAAFTTVISAARAVTVDSPFTAGSLYFDDDDPYTLRGGGRITLDVSAGGARIDVKDLHGGAAHTIAAPLALDDDTTIDVAAASLLGITSQMSAAPGVTLTKAGPGTLAVRNVRADGLAIEAGAVRVLPDGGPEGVSVAKDLVVAGESRLDLADNVMVVDYTGAASPLARLRDLIESGFAAGAWDGAGITSSAAAAHPSLALGYGEASAVLGPAGGQFVGQEVDATAVLIRLTLRGDANLDGAVSFPDLVALAQNYNTLTGDAPWTRGDFNYDGNVNFADLAALAQNYNTALPASAIRGAAAGFQEDAARAFAAVPEPSGACLTVLVAAAVGRRRRCSSV